MKKKDNEKKLKDILDSAKKLGLRRSRLGRMAFGYAQRCSIYRLKQPRESTLRRLEACIEEYRKRLDAEKLVDLYLQGKIILQRVDSK